ncbi:hypothetical protein, partial [Lactococcus petauri]|uniref:hypothetical protein n=1 Tax=Lactococcus petauri TaxID=1940789 RepID=UPI0021F21FBF
TKITGRLTGTGGVGTYTVDLTQTAASTSITATGATYAGGTYTVDARNGILRQVAGGALALDVAAAGGRLAATVDYAYAAITGTRV